MMNSTLVILLCAVLLVSAVAASDVEELQKKQENVDQRQNMEIALLKEMMRILQVKLNDSDLEARVTVLEENVDDLEFDVLQIINDVNNVESVNILQNEQLNTLETEIFDNDQDIEELVSITNQLGIQTTELEEDIIALDHRVGDLESGEDGGGNANVTDLTERVEALEEVTSQLSGDISDLQATTDDFETRIQTLEEAVIDPLAACLSSPCSNNGTCVDVNVDTFVCLCRDGYFGVTCQDSYQDSIFLAALTTSEYGLSQVVFDREEINPGGHYDGSLGWYTVPYDGIYQFSVNLQYSSYVAFTIQVGNTVFGQHTDNYYDVAVHYRSVTFIQQLNAGDIVMVRLVSTNGGAQGCEDHLCSYFTGHLISAN